MAEIALAAVATADQCIRLVGTLRSRYQDYQRADQELSELVLSFEHYFIKIDRQVRFLKQIWQSLDDELQILQNHLLSILSQKLEEAVAMLDTTIGRKDQSKVPSLKNLGLDIGVIRKMKYVLSRKECLRTTLVEIGRWQLMFDPAWILLTRSSDDLLDKTLRQYRADDEGSSPLVTLKRMRQAGLGTRNGERGPIEARIDVSSLSACSNLSTAVVQLKSGEDILVSTFVPHPRALMTDVRQDIHRLDQSLSQSEPMTFGLLKSLGVVDRVSNDSGLSAIPGIDQSTLPRSRVMFHFILQIPTDLGEPKTLRALLTSEPVSSLNTRLTMAQCLSNAIMFLHSCSFVHKNVRPETIMCFKVFESESYAPFLVGFEDFRAVQGQSLFEGSESWERDLYRHPARQGVWPQEKYVMQHDIYSLGVVLLELGLWTSFVVKDGTGSPAPAETLSIAGHLAERTQRLRTSRIKSELIRLAKTQLPVSMGNRYRDVVISCLTCLDISEPGLGRAVEFQDKDKVAIGVRFAEKVIVELHGISF